MDYVGWSSPLILMTFIATGLAIAMLSADSLSRIDVTNHVLSVVEQEVKPLIKMLTGEDPSMMTMMGVKFKVRSMLDATIPPAKASMYAMGLTKLMVLEVGPLLTALLLCGRIGGSYAGKIATMHATSQMALLETLGIHPYTWSLLPSLTAAIIAAPILTATGTALALYLGGIVGPRYGVGTWEGYCTTVQETIFPELRLQTNNNNSNFWWLSLYGTTTTFSTSYYDTVIEIVTYPPIHHVMKSVTFMVIIMSVAEMCCKFRILKTNRLTPRGVPNVITSSVVTAGLLVILADWGFSQLWLLRH
jgi:ABC-type transporter Mla maintaining outer membrane lipid asymmetry permease subunit MlaE